MTKPKITPDIVAWTIGWAEDGEDGCILGVDKRGDIVKKLSHYLDSREKINSVGAQTKLPSWTEYKKLHPKVMVGRFWMCEKTYPDVLYSSLQAGTRLYVVIVARGLATVEHDVTSPDGTKRVQERIPVDVFREYARIEALVPTVTEKVGTINSFNPAHRLRLIEAARPAPTFTTEPKENAVLIPRLHIAERHTASGWALIKDTMSLDKEQVEKEIAALQLLYRQSEFRVATYIRGLAGRIIPAKEPVPT